MNKPEGLYCDFAGHEFKDAGGGLEICALCEAEQWSNDKSPLMLPDNSELFDIYEDLGPENE